VTTSLQRLLGGLANCAGRRCRSQPALKLKFRGCTKAIVGGKGKPREATFYLRGKRIRRDVHPPIEARLPRSAGARLTAVATSLDGRTVSLQRRLPSC
jgi:hypothetical protein